MILDHPFLLFSQPFAVFSLPISIISHNFPFQNYTQTAQINFLKRESQRIFSLSPTQAQSLLESTLESMDGLIFFPFESWPQKIRSIIQQNHIGDSDTFQLILFSYGNGLPPRVLLDLLFLKYRSSPNKLPKRINQIHWIVQAIPHKSHSWYYYDISEKRLLHLNGTPHHP